MTSEGRRKPKMPRVSATHQPSKAELDESIHLPGRSPEHVARIVMQGGARRREPGNTES